MKVWTPQFAVCPVMKGIWTLLDSTSRSCQLFCQRFLTALKLSGCLSWSCESGVTFALQPASFWFQPHSGTMWDTCQVISDYFSVFICTFSKQCSRNRSDWASIMAAAKQEGEMMEVPSAVLGKVQNGELFVMMVAGRKRKWVPVMVEDEPQITRLRRMKSEDCNSGAKITCSLMFTSPIQLQLWLQFRSGQGNHGSFKLSM